jgi:cytidyltransferase-like protein
VIVPTSELTNLRGKVAMVDGGFDPIHDGHIDYFREASELGSPVLCNVSSDAWVETKHPPLLGHAQRARIIDAIRYIDYVHISQMSTASVLQELVPEMYVKGVDWEGRLPAEETELCESLGIRIVFLDTVSDSSSRILSAYGERNEK